MTAPVDVLREIAARIEGGPVWACTHGHDTHGSYALDVVLDGPHPYVPDFPTVPHHLRAEFPMRVWDWRTYQGLEGYCPANDVVSECIETQDVWEGYGTNLALAICRHEGSPSGLPADQVVIDCGSQVGWYTMIATACGWPALAVDADPSTLELLKSSAELAGVGDLVVPCRAGINVGTPVVEPAVSGVRLLKVDVEGAEDEVVRVFAPMFDAGLVSFVMMEISPCFDAYYPDLCARMIDDYRFEAYLVPGKNEDMEAFGTDPLRALLPYRLHRETIKEAVASWHQRDILFVHESLAQWL